MLLSFVLSQATAKLLNEDCTRFCRTEEQNSIHAGYIDTLIEDINSKQDLRRSFLVAL